jgi:hypothetical protein
LLSEAERVKSVSNRLEWLADRHPHVTQALLTIAESIRSTATLVEVLVATKVNVPRPSEAPIGFGKTGLSGVFS